MKEKITLNILGMHCASCAVNIENTLRKEKGVESVSVNIASEKAYLEIENAETNIDKIIKTIEKLGYKAERSFSGELHEHHGGNGGDWIKKSRRQFILSLLFGLPIIYIVMAEMLGLPALPLPTTTEILVMFALSTIIVSICSDIWKTGLKGLVNLAPDMNSLIFIGTAAAYFYSVAILIFKLLGKKLDAPVFFESAVFVLIFVSLGEYLETAAKGRTSDAVEKLIKLQPKEATVIRDGREVKIPTSEISVDDTVIVKPGEKIPVDGIVVDGYSGVDEQVITGESIPREKKKDNKVIAATINKTGVLRIRATKVGSDTFFGQIIQTVETALGSKPPIQLLADKISFYFVPAVISIAVISFALWLILGEPFSFALTILVSVLVVACPCALGLATPTAVMVGTGIAAQKGILIKNGFALEAAKAINFVVFDKTGTLTTGKAVVTDMVGVLALRTEVLKTAASLEVNSEHPLAQAIIKKAEEEKIGLIKTEEFLNYPGKGISGKINGNMILFGTKKLMVENKIDTSLLDQKIAILENQGKTVMLLSKDKKILGLIAVADILKKHSKEAVKMLHDMGKKVAILTGDNKHVARAIAQEIQADRVIAEILPQEKAKEIAKLQLEGNIVAMVGDGINDAPALAQADLGIAIGSGTDIAIETGEIVLIKDDLRDVVKAIGISKDTMDKINQNLFWAFFYNIILIPVAAGLLYKPFGILLGPTLSAAAMAFSSVSVVSNSILLKYKNQ